MNTNQHTSAKGLNYFISVKLLILGTNVPNARVLMGQNTVPNVHANSVKFCEYFLLLLLCVHVIPLFEYWLTNKFLYISST